MLGKLLKYDLKSLFSLLIPLYLGGLILSITNGFLLIPIQTKIEMLQFDLWSTMLELFHGMSIMAILSLNLITIIWCVIRVYNSLFAKEGYLTNTLPVSHHKILASKIISSFIAMTVSSLVIMILSLIFYAGYFNFDFNFTPLLQYINVENITEFLNVVPFSFIYSTFLCALVVTVGYILVILVSIAIGHLTNHRILIGFISFFVIQYVAIQPATTAILFSSVTSQFYKFNSILDNSVFSNFISFIWIIIALYAVISALCYLVTSYILKNKLNLQ